MVVKNRHVIEEMQINMEDITLFFKEERTVHCLFCAKTFIVLDK
jgi:hypothetical protein